ncbi:MULTISPECIES: type II toxin-antitoxin system RelE/ParE family toxin [unclassified Roseofilum]|uniref:type II toxin-antitoxin system RelE/ParE family toxin n=1 Tax=unclassified Roseofilum TaxID=2620099 RepID=UPI001B2794FD|nr:MULTISPECIES: type II toxin-antitoxin system RelE/ParE family toxin [unclassified Roseofilum]MBP0006899.1 type II toxin-antitoxin system RelE/ParE family toxin [Roseofilum sp. Belize Diploria]MBP0043348.1 type II toxin-antitoxin system RelE/ParE family toxin [Roseofilum sp. SBFL]
MAVVNWSSKALDDVDAIAAYIARDSTAYASAVVQEIIDVTRNLQQFPLKSCRIAQIDDTP